MTLHKCDRCGEIFEAFQLKPYFCLPFYELCCNCSCELLKFVDGEKQEEETAETTEGETNDEC